MCAFHEIALNILKQKFSYQSHTGISVVENTSMSKTVKLYKAQET